MAASDWTDEPPTLGSAFPDPEDPSTLPVKTWGGLAQSADDAVRAAANAVSFGMADRLAGAVPVPGFTNTGGGTERQVQLSEAARERSPVASTVGDVAGAAALPGFGAEALAARMGGGLLARGGAYGLTGAATGAAQGAGGTYTGNPSDYVQNAMIGGTLGGAFGAGGGAAFGLRAPKSTAKTPILAEQQEAKNLAYDALGRNTAQYAAQHLAERANVVERDLYGGTGYARPAGRFPAGERDSPSTWRSLDEMRQPHAEAVAENAATPGARTEAWTDPAGIESIRKGLNKIPPSAERATDRTSARVVKSALDDFLINPPPGAVRPGYEAAARDAAGIAQWAREQNAAFKQQQAIEALRDKAIIKAGVNNSGLNIEAGLRGRIGAFVAPNESGVSPAIKKGFNPEQIDRLTAFAQGTPWGNRARYAANVLGGGGGLAALAASSGGFGTGAYYFKDDPEFSRSLALASGVLSPATGLGLRMGVNRAAQKNMQQLIDAVAQRSPLYRARLATAPMTQSGSPATAQATRDAIATALLRRQRPADEGWTDAP